MADRPMLELGRKILASQPFSAFLVAELLGLAEGAAELSVPIRPEFAQQHGFVHDGIVSYAADNALTFAGGTVLGTAVVTSEFKINYLRPARSPWIKPPEHRERRGAGPARRDEGPVAALRARGATQSAAPTTQNV